MTHVDLKKKPKRVLKFSDGVLEEYSSEDEVDNCPKKQIATIDPVSTFIFLFQKKKNNDNNNNSGKKF